MAESLAHRRSVHTLPCFVSRYAVRQSVMALDSLQHRPVEVHYTKPSARDGIPSQIALLVRISVANASVVSTTGNEDDLFYLNSRFFCMCLQGPSWIVAAGPKTFGEEGFDGTAPCCNVDIFPLQSVLKSLTSRCNSLPNVESVTVFLIRVLFQVVFRLLSQITVPLIPSKGRNFCFQIKPIEGKVSALSLSRLTFPLLTIDYPCYQFPSLHVIKMLGNAVHLFPCMCIPPSLSLSQLCWYLWKGISSFFLCPISLPCGTLGHIPSHTPDGGNFLL